MPKQERAVHPAANIFPMMGDAEFELLVADMRANGQQENIVYYKGTVLDGRNRLKACKELGIKPNECELEDDVDPVAWVISANLHRRQLKASQKAMCAAKLEGLPNGRPKGNPANLPGLAGDDLAAMFGVSERAIRSGRRVLKEGCKELIALCEQGKSVATACKFIDELPAKSEQVPKAKEGWKAIQEFLKADANDKPSAEIDLPDNADESTVAAVEAWLEQQDDRPPFERFKTFWGTLDDGERAAVGAFVSNVNAAAK